MAQRDDLLHRLARASRLRVFAAALVVGLLGLFVPGPIGSMILLVVVAGMAILLSRTWDVTDPSRRLPRLLVLAGLAAVAAAKLF